MIYVLILGHLSAYLLITVLYIQRIRIIKSTQDHVMSLISYNKTLTPLGSRVDQAVANDSKSCLHINVLLCIEFVLDPCHHPYL